MNKETILKIADVIALPIAILAVVMYFLDIPWLFKTTSYLAIHALVLAIALWALSVRWPKKMKLIGLAVLTVVALYVLLSDGLSNWVTWADLIPEKLGGGSGWFWRVIDFLDVTFGLCLLPAILGYLGYKRYQRLNK